jgi:hypothetical protein
MMTKVITALFIPVLCLSLCSCVKTGLSDDEKCSIVCEIAEICLEQYSNGNCEKETDIRMDQIQRWTDPDSKIHEALKKDENVKYYYAVVLDEGTVLVGTDSLFQSASGYLITNRPIESGSPVKVHDNSDFDGNRIFIGSKVKDGVYKYSAGL